MDNLKRIFQSVNPSLHSSTDDARQAHDVSESVKEVTSYNLFQTHYKQQHLASMAETQAVFELQKKYLEKRIQYVNMKIEKIDQTCLNLQNKLDRLKGDPDWVKFG